MNAITTLADTASVSPEPHAAESLDLYKIAAEYGTYSLDALYQEIAKLKEDVPQNRTEAAAMPIRMGLLCIAIRKLASKGAVQKTIEQSGIPYYTANNRMKLVKALMKASPSTVQTFLSLGAARLVEISRLSKTYIEALATKGEYEGVSLDDLKVMGERDLRATCKFSACPDTVTPLRNTTPHSAAPQHDALAVGDRVESLHARRPGRIVRTYPDGSASVCWDDGEPQETGLGHERMPRALLILVDHEQASVLGQKTGIDSQGFPNDRAILDPLNYVEAAKALCDASDVILMGLACEVDVAFSRLGVLLRSINEAMSSPQFKEDDVQILVDMALEKLPDHDALFEQMEQLDRDLKWDFHERLEERRCLEAVIDAMTLAATPETPIVDIEKAAGAVYDQALGNPIYAPRWRALRIFLEQRGLVVKEEPIIEGGRPYACVQTPDQVEAERKEIRRATKATRAAAKVHD